MVADRYFFSNGYRLVVPYLHTSRIFVREGGRNVTEVLLKRWPNLQTSAIESAISGGRLSCNSTPLDSPHRVLNKNDVLGFTNHYHEPEVLADQVDILHVDDDMVVVNKPSSIPVHPAGVFRRNSIQRILLFENPYLLADRPPAVVHRIDRLASGLLIFARTQASLAQYCAQFTQRTIKKEYLARVKGTFPDGIVEVDEPIARLQTYPIIYGTSPEGKPSVTVFRRESVSTDGSESIVRCRPITGRPHQIRAHLKWLNHPISNDYKYGGDLALSYSDKPIPELKDYVKMSWCQECKSGTRNTEHIVPADLKSTHIWLHSLRYTSTHPKHKWTFEAPRPAWSYL